MGTTNILDLNNRLTKVEKENVSQNSYTSLKNKPKINGVTLTGNKSLVDIGAAAANDVGELTDLTTTDKSSCVGAINEVKSGLTDVANEIEDFRKRYNGGELWPGDTLTFNNVRASSNFVYRFMAFDTTAAGTPESAYLIVKSNTVQVYDKVGTFTTAYDAEHEILSIKLPSSSYWDYRFEVAARRNG